MSAPSPQEKTSQPPPCQARSYTALDVRRPQTLPKPAWGKRIRDPAFGACVTRVSDQKRARDPLTGPTYSQLQAWNADQSLILLRSGLVLDARSYAPLHKIDFGWPSWGVAPRWSPVEPRVIYYLGGVEPGYSDGIDCPAGRARLMRYRLVGGGKLSGRRELVQCFSEYRELKKDPSWEEMSDDGRYLALVGERAKDGVYEAFVYDVKQGVKHKPLALPVHERWGPMAPDWAAMSPSGNYVLLQWAPGTGRYEGLEAYDPFTMDYVGKVTVNSGHGDLTRDAAGNEYFVQTNANNAYLLNDRHYITRSRIPEGVIFDGNGNVDAARTVSSGATRPLLVLDWHHSVHVSCRNQLAPGPCLVSTLGGEKNGWQVFENEIFLLDLNSRPGAERVQRLAHHRSDYQYVESHCDFPPYWATSHATINRRGTQALFGSNWQKGCAIESYVIDIPK